MDDLRLARIAAEFSGLAHQLAQHDAADGVLQAIVVHAKRSIPGTEDAAITVQRAEESYITVAATGELPGRVDAIQYQTGQGPCLAAIRDHHTFLVDDYRSDQRWPLFATRAVEETGVLSMLSHRLFLEEEETIGALNLYSTKPDAFTDESLDVLNLYATHAAVVLDAAKSRIKSQHLERALASNRRIGMAIGILMSRYKLSAHDAFDVLRIASQNGHRKLSGVAEDVIETGDIDL